MYARVMFLAICAFHAFYASDARHPATSENTIGLNAEVSNANTCILCEEYATRAVEYFSSNKTRQEILVTLHKSCSSLGYFKNRCDSLVDKYPALFFLALSNIHPLEFCEKVYLCGQPIRSSTPIYENSCGFCHQAVEKIIEKLKHPDTQLKIMELVWKGCSALETDEKNCKNLVLEEGPAIVENAERFLDICTTLRACPSSMPLSIHPTLREASLMSDS